MLGWPSPTYPNLVGLDSPIPITMGQSAMVAGFLMFGVSFGTIFSRKMFRIGPKFGIIFGNICIVLGWVIMWQANAIYGLLASRLLLGTGHGYAMGQIKIYIHEMTEDDLTGTLIKHLNFYGLFGFVMAYAMGPFVDFRQYAWVSLIVASGVLLIAIFLPATPRELIRASKMPDARKLIMFLKPESDVDSELCKIMEKMTVKLEDPGFTKLMRDRELRTNLIKLTFLLICQQYSGVPPTLVYTQIIYIQSKVPYPEFFSMGHAVLFLFCNILGTYVSSRFNRKVTLLVSSGGVIVLLMCEVAVIYYKVNEQYFSYASVIVLYLFICVHTLGLGSIPFMLIHDWFPPNYRGFVTNYFIILFNILALTITKTFQVLMTQFSLFMPFLLFLGVVVFAFIFILFFIPYSFQKTSFYQTNIRECTDMRVKK
ncbi:hypothetical protein ABEB36_009701 [Hypothenemus hampei]